eukprot:83897-Pleurochrysis_carterae.AAC.2
MRGTLAGRHEAFAQYKTVLAEVQTPTDESNQTATPKTIEIIAVMAAAALMKTRDPNNYYYRRQAIETGQQRLFPPQRRRASGNA